MSSEARKELRRIRKHLKKDIVEAKIGIKRDKSRLKAIKRMIKRVRR